MGAVRHNVFHFPENRQFKCIKKAEKDKEKEAECEQYLKAADALK
jgi:hypothetical protein